MAEELCHEGHTVLGTTATWCHTLELQVWWPQDWTGGREADSIRRHIPGTGHPTPPGTVDYVPIGACSFVPGSVSVFFYLCVPNVYGAPDF